MKKKILLKIFDQKYKGRKSSICTEIFDARFLGFSMKFTGKFMVNRFWERKWICLKPFLGCGEGAGSPLILR